MYELLLPLLGKESAWLWEEAQQTAFQRVKDMLVSPEVLTHYDPNRPTVIAADAFLVGIGAVLLQIKNGSICRSVCCSSRSHTETEKRYAVENEALAATWACEKLTEYVMRLHFMLVTNHKPPLTLLKRTELTKMPPRIQRFRLRRMRCNSEVAYLP